jgi:two-component sensor histidine kinase
MPAVLARPTVVLASDGNRKTNRLAQPPPPTGEGYRPMKGLLALCERPAGVIAVTTLAEVLSRISGSARVPFGQYLRDLRHDIARTHGASSGARLTCAAADVALPIGSAVTLRLIADLLICNTSVDTLSPGPTGWIAVSFTADPEAWQLAVEDSGIAMPADDKRRDHGLTLVRLLVLQLGGKLEIHSTPDRTRCIVTISRAGSRTADD